MLVPCALAAVGTRSVGAALYDQLRPISRDLTGRVIEDCGRVVALDRPQSLHPSLLDSLAEFLP